MSTTVHHIARTGFGDGTNELYDRARPSFQEHGIEYIRQAVRSEPPLNILEIGSGTGLFTRALLSSPSWTTSVRQLRAVEPSEGMRTQFLKKNTDGRVTCSDGVFDRTGVEDGWADIIIIAQAFHWCPDYNAAAAEFARVLKPDGVVAMIWNLEDRDRARWVAQLRDRIESHEEGTPQFRLGLWRAFFDAENYQKYFTPHEEKQWPYTIPTTVDITAQRALTKSYITVLPEEKKQAVEHDVREIVTRGDDLVWMEKDNGVFEYPYKTYVVICHKK